MAKNIDTATEVSDYNPVGVMDEPHAAAPIGVGSMVLYTLDEKTSPLKAGEVRPAVITALYDDGRASLCVMIGHPDDFRPKVGPIPGYGNRGSAEVPAYIFPAFAVFGVNRDDAGAHGTWRPQ